MNFKPGFQQALEMLSGLDEKARKKILEKMKEKDPEMAKALQENLISFEDLSKLSPQMFQELLREISVDDLALALRIGSESLKNNIFQRLSSRLKKDVEDILLGPPRPVDEVQEALNRIMDVVRAKADKGELIFKNAGDDDLV